MLKMRRIVLAGYEQMLVTLWQMRVNAEMANYGAITLAKHIFDDAFTYIFVERKKQTDRKSVV